MVMTLLAVAPAMAEKGDSKVRFGLQWVSPTGDYTEEELGIQLKLEATDAVGFFGSYEYYLSNLIGIGAGLGYAQHDVDATLSFMDMSETVKFGEISATPLVFALNFHLLGESNLDFYLGLQAAYVMVSNVTNVIDDEADIEMKNGTGFGAVAGIDIPFGGGNWMFSGALQYLGYGAEVDEPDADVTVDINPITLQVGLGVKF
jgi:outer membrane protein W